jgi:hypothetical protein
MNINKEELDSKLMADNDNLLKRVCINGNIKLDKQFNSGETIANVKEYLSVTNHIPIDSILLKCKNVVLTNEEKLANIQPASKVIYVFSKVNRPEIAKTNTDTDTIKIEKELCNKNCGFYGDPINDGMCSKCFKDSQPKQKKRKKSKKSKDKVSDLVTTNVTTEHEEPAATVDNTKLKCLKCNVNLHLLPFKCKCGGNFCVKHRYSFEHNCVFDYAKEGYERLKISLKNQECKPEKVRKI